ncbi:hypothetical protein EC991_003707 [Linnemannia zychae]|nr:hypothetical protein EC991_003707 [Linnemannia zychae]
MSGVLLTPSLPFPLTLPVLPPSTSDISLSSTTTAPTISQPSDATATSTNKPAVEQQGTGGQPESVEWPWTHMNPADRDRWLTAFHISAQHGGILALPPTYSPGSELDEASALSLSRTHSNTGVIDYGSSVMEARRYFGTGGESVQSSLAGSRVSAGAGSLYYDETLGQTPYGNGYFNGPLGHYGQPEQFAPTHTYQPTGY